MAQVITVSQLNRYVRGQLEKDPHLQGLYVSGELSNFNNNYSSGHLYMSLKDSDALVRAVMFKSAAARLQFTPQNGMKVIVRANVSLYERDGAFQLYIEEMQPDGVGSLQLAYEQLKNRLAAEGLFDEKSKKTLPRFPARIGVITSPTGAAVRDIISVLKRRYPLAVVVLAPVQVQGEAAALQLIAALERLNQLRAADAIIIGRGGGSLEDLWAFNDERLARAVKASVIPVISAVGHETDFTICDFAADLRAPTPSAAAELAVPDRSQLSIRIREIQQSTAKALHNRVTREHTRLSALRSRRCLSAPTFFVDEQRMKLDFLTRLLTANAQTVTNQSDRRLAAVTAKLDALSPLKVLARGYAIAKKDGQAVLSAGALTAGDRISLCFADGGAECDVISAG
ncbi:MAG: exodeoxyribonuclease VII large subunit [Oscillospiraceae bacterium]|nr:exodeoxyribonuclease VII large subunit [Oscillospiraceae bacterium]